MEKVSVEQQSVKFLLSLKSDLNLLQLTVMFGLEGSITLQLRDDLKKSKSTRGLTHIHLLRSTDTSDFMGFVSVVLTGKFSNQLISCFSYLLKLFDHYLGKF